MSLKNKSGGYDNYSIRSATLIEGYVPGPMRTNILLDADKVIGRYDPGTFANDSLLNGPGTLVQSLPDASSYQFDNILATPRGNAYRNFTVDDRQIASYLIDNLHKNPLSQYSTEPNSQIPKFECSSNPSNFSSMSTKRSDDYKSYFDKVFPDNWEYIMGAQEVYPIKSGNKTNSNLDIVYNLSTNSTQETNPFIAMGSSNNRITRPMSNLNKCYSGDYQSPKMRNTYVPRTDADVGLNNIGSEVCIPDKAFNYANVREI